MTPQDFIASVFGGAQQFQLKSHVFASVTIAQAALETGWGAFVPVDATTGKKSYNLFGIKGDGTNGHVTSQTWEGVNGQKETIMADFRAYNSFAESIADHAAVLLNDRYAPVRNAATPEEAAQQLYTCGYATDPDYASKLINIIATYNLKQYDLVTLMPKDRADEMIKWFQSMYQLCGMTGVDNPIHKYCNWLREASGQPTT